MKKGVVWFSNLVVMWGLCISVGLIEASASEEKDADKPGGLTSLEERVAQLENAVSRKVAGEGWFDRINISGLIEVEANYQSIDDADNSDVDLATVELAVDARIVEYVDGHVLFKYEEDDVFVDEGFITLTGTDAFPAYLIAGRQYVPFGNFDSHFITDPNTLLLGETNEGAVVVGYRIAGELVDVAVGAFNGKIGDDDDDDMIDSYVAGVTTQPLEGLTLGISYISNLASSDSFSDEIVSDPIENLVDGWSAFVAFELLDRFKVIGEYMAALDDFEAGEVYDAADTENREPSAWNVEFGAMVVESLELAVRYGGSDDGGQFLPETQYGVVVNWGCFDNTNLALEYLRDDYEDNDDKVDTITAQLAVAF